MKKCARCSEIKSRDLFCKQSKTKDQLKAWCKACDKEYRLENKDSIRESIKSWKKEHPEEVRASQHTCHIQRKYKLSKSEYQDKIDAQNSSCEICGLTCSSGRRLAVDHCHRTNKVRGLLCMHCNHAIGKFKDSTDLLHSAIKYLEKYK